MIWLIIFLRGDDLTQKVRVETTEDIIHVYNLQRKRENIYTLGSKDFSDGVG